MAIKETVTALQSQGSLIAIIYQGGWLSILVLVVLLIMSVISWAVILRKWLFLAKIARNAKRFSVRVDFANGLAEMILRAEQYPHSYCARLFQNAYAAFGDQINRYRADPGSFDRGLFIQKLERRLEKSMMSEKTAMESELGILATISSSAPFIGLLGTVTGIIDSFYSIAAQGASSIAVVAPGISAALVATAVGLFTAIPALIGYNIFREKARSLSNEMNGFGLDLLNLFDQNLDDKATENGDAFPEIKLGGKAN